MRNFDFDRIVKVSDERLRPKYLQFIGKFLPTLFFVWFLLAIIVVLNRPFYFLSLIFNR